MANVVMIDLYSAIFVLTACVVKEGHARRCVRQCGRLAIEVACRVTLLQLSLRHTAFIKNLHPNVVNLSRLQTHQWVFFPIPRGCIQAHCAHRRFKNEPHRATRRTDFESASASNMSVLLCPTWVLLVQFWSTASSPTLSLKMSHCTHDVSPLRRPMTRITGFCPLRSHLKMNVFTVEHSLRSAHNQ